MSNTRSGHIELREHFPKIIRLVHIHVLGNCMVVARDLDACPTSGKVVSCQSISEPTTWILFPYSKQKTNKAFHRPSAEEALPQKRAQLFAL